MHTIEHTTETPITDTILIQLGGTRLIGAMTGAKHFVKDEDNRRVNIGLPRQKCVRITLEANDTYTVEFLRISTRKEWAAGADMLKVTKCVEHVYATELVETFEEVTGLYLTLFPKK